MFLKKIKLVPFERVRKKKYNFMTFEFYDLTFMYSYDIKSY